MKVLWLRALALAFALGVMATPAVKAEDKDGYIALFNGKDLTGWTIPDPPSNGFAKMEWVKEGDKNVAIKAKDKKDKEYTLWQIKDGCLVGGGPMSHIFTERKDFKNFKFRVEVKINDKGNSGMFFRAGFRPGVPKGYEVQINATHGDRVKTGSIYPNAEFGLDKFKATNCIMDKAAHKPDEFFVQEVVCEDAKITTYVNGVKQIEWTDPDHRFKEGHFALQGHDPGSIMTFKKVEVKILK